MAIRAPLYWDGSDLREMTAAEVDEWVDRIIYEYSLNPSVELSGVATSGSLSPTMTDTRKTAGAYVARVDRYAFESETPEPGTATVNYDRVDVDYNAVSPTTDTGTTFPVYWDGSDIRAMNITDLRDTFLHPAIDLMTTGSLTLSQGGTYHVQSTTTYTGSTRVYTTPIYVDTRANTGAYTAGGIPETLDQPTTITNYYLFVVNGSINIPTRTPLYINGDNDLQDDTVANWAALLGEHLRDTARNSLDGYSIRYNIGTSGSGTIRGTGMIDTILNGSGAYNILFVNSNDYRAQEFPNGTAVTSKTYYLRIEKT